MITLFFIWFFFKLYLKIQYWLFQNKILKKHEIEDEKIICIGDIELGGTGKTPIIGYILDSIAEKNNVFVLSKGENRKTKKFINLNKLNKENINAKIASNEAFSMYLKHNTNKNINIVVDKNRIHAINILKSEKKNHIFLLDDAFQYKKLRCNCNIILVRYDNPFYKDKLLPFGRLKDLKRSIQEADMVIITKCPENINKEKIDIYKMHILKFVRPNIPILFSKIKYGRPYNLFNSSTLKEKEKIVILSGIALPIYFEKFARTSYEVIKDITFKNNNEYKKEDIDNILYQCKILKVSNILTTEKDAARLIDHSKDFQRLNVFVLPIKTEFTCIEDKISFDKFINCYIN